MDKVIIIGCPGSGKSTFARKLSKLTGLPLYYLDMMYWNEDRTTVPKETFISALNDVLAEPLWIIDGNYISTMEMRMEKCDTVFFLDYTTDVCISGVTERMGKPREDMPWFEVEPDKEFMSFIQNFETDQRHRIFELLSRYSYKKTIVFHTRDEAEQYLAEYNCELFGR